MWRIAMPGAGAIHSSNDGPWLAFGAVCPARGVGAGLVLPFADIAAMNATWSRSRIVAPFVREMIHRIIS
jgi:hypothetical protein